MCCSNGDNNFDPVPPPPGSNLWAPGTGAGAVLDNNGTGNLAGGDQSLSAGAGSSAPGAQAIALGRGAIAAGDQSIATGNSRADGAFSSAAGDHSRAIREAQTVHASGRFSVNGDAQSSWLEMRGSTPGAAPDETVELKFGDAADQTFQCEDGKGYTLTVTAVAKDTVAGGKGVQSFTQRFAVRRAAGVTVIAGMGAADQFGDAASTTWTLVASIGVAPDRFTLTFTTTGTQAAARCVAKLGIVEVLNA